MLHVFSWLVIIALGMEYCDRSPCLIYEKQTSVIKGDAKCEAQQKIAMTGQCTSICPPKSRDKLPTLITGDLYISIQWTLSFAIVRSSWFAYTFQNNWKRFAIAGLSLPVCSTCSLFDSISELSYEIHHTDFHKLVVNINFIRYQKPMDALELNTLRQMDCFVIIEQFEFTEFTLIFNSFSLSQMCSLILTTPILITVGFDLFMFWHIHQISYYYSSYYNELRNNIVSPKDDKIMRKTNHDNLFDLHNDSNSIDISNDDYWIGELNCSKSMSWSSDSDSANYDISLTDDRNFVDISADCISTEKGFNADFISPQNNYKDNISPNEDNNICSSNTDKHIENSKENDQKDRSNDDCSIYSSNDDVDDNDSSNDNDENQFGSVFVIVKAQRDETCNISFTNSTDSKDDQNTHRSGNSEASGTKTNRLVCKIIESPDVDLKSDSLENDSNLDLKSDSANDDVKKILRQNIFLQNPFQQMLTVLPVHNDQKQKTDSTQRNRRSIRQTELRLANGRTNSASKCTSFDCTDQVLSPPTNDRSHNDNLALSNERGYSNIANALENVSGIENGAKVFPSVDAKQGSNSSQGNALKCSHKHNRRNKRRKKTKVPCNDEADSAPLLRASNEILDAPPVDKPRLNSSKLKCFELQSAVQETKPDQAVLSELGACGGDPLSVGYGTEETQIAEAETEVDGVGDTAQESSKNHATRHSSRTTIQTPPEVTTRLQNERHDIFPDPAVDDSDLQRFEPMMVIIDKIAVGERVPPQITMRYEMLRLCTLRSFPKVNKPFIIRIAQAGFYYANSGDELVCYCCAKRKSGWQETDVPLDVHRQLSPNCRFLMSNSEVNVSVKRQEILASRRSVSAARVTSAADDTENNATAASQRIHNPISDPHQNSTREVFRRSPAQFGNATTSHNSSQGLTSSVAAPAPPSTVLHPNSIPNTGLTRTANTMNTNRPTAQYNNQATPVRSPKYPAYVTLTTRQVSFRDCIELAVPADILAEAGFFYAGFGDCCRCFQCGVGLRHWSAEDDPWIEHSRWSKNCSYVREKKGEEFSNLVQMAVEYQQSQERSQEPQQSTARGPGERPERANRNVDSLLHSDAAQSVLEMGYTPEMIRRAIQIVLNNVSSEGNITAALLMEQIFAMEESETPQTTDPQAPTPQDSLTPASAPEVSTSVALPPQLPATVAPTSTLARAPPTSEHQTLIPNATSTQAQTSMTSATKPRDHTAKNQNNDEVTSPEVEGATATSSRNATRKMPSLEQKKLREENARMKQQTICTKCKQNDVSIVFLPCGHLVTCEACAETVRYCTERNCGKYIKGTVRTYAA